MAQNVTCALFFVADAEWRELWTRKPYLDPYCGDCEEETCIGCEIWENAVRQDDD